jgi:hypothetical protein
MGSRIGRPAGLLLALLVALGAPARAQQQGAAEIFQMLNDQTSAIYQTTKQRFLAAANPVVMVGYDSGAFDSVMIRQGGETRHLGQTPSFNYPQARAEPASSMPKAMSVSRERPRHMTMAPGGGSLARAR